MSESITLRLEEIQVRERTRKDLGKLDDLHVSIKARGLLHPPVVRRDGDAWVLVAGLRRLTVIRDRLKWASTLCTVATSVADEVAAMRAEGEENVCRKQFAPSEAAALAARIRPLEEAAARERQQEAGRKHGRGQIADGNLPQAIEEKEQKKARSRTAKAVGYKARTLDKATEVARAADDESLPAPVREVAQKAVARMDKTGKVDGAHREVREAKERAAAEAKPAVVETGSYKLIHCRAKDLAVEPGTVDLIFTDPPYGKEWLDAWTELADLAVKALVPGGLVVAYSGQYWLPETMARLAAELDYFWCYAITHNGAFFQHRERHIQCAWKPLLVYRKAGDHPPPWHKDAVSEGQREKSDHEWQQAEVEAAYWIGKLTAPGSLIVDPFLGGATTAVAATKLGRRFLGCDIDKLRIAKGEERLA